MTEQEIYMEFTPYIADMIIEYDTAEAYRQLEIMSELVKYCVIFQLDGMFQRAYHELIELGWMTADGKILIDLKTTR